MIGDPQHKSGLACNTDADGGSRTKNSNGISAYGLNFGVPSSFVSKTLDICAYVSDLVTRRFETQPPTIDRAIPF